MPCSFPAYWDIAKAHRYLRFRTGSGFPRPSDIISTERFRERTLAYLSVRKQGTEKTGEPVPQFRNKCAAQAGKLLVPKLEISTKILFVYP